MKGLTIAQWINLNWNNSSVLEHQYSVLREKTVPILPRLVGLMVGREAVRLADEIGVDFKIYLKFSTG